MKRFTAFAYKGRGRKPRIDVSIIPARHNWPEQIAKTFRAPKRAGTRRLTGRAAIVYSRRCGTAKITAVSAKRLPPETRSIVQTGLAHSPVGMSVTKNITVTVSGTHNGIKPEPAAVSRYRFRLRARVVLPLAMPSPVGIRRPRLSSATAQPAMHSIQTTLIASKAKTNKLPVQTARISGPMQNRSSVTSTTGSAVVVSGTTN